MKKFLILLLLVLVSFACKKENQIEKNLWKKGGEWNIVSWHVKSTSTHFPEDNYTETRKNVGTMKFNKDGSGSFILTEGTSAYTEPFTYHNTESTLTIFDEDGDGEIFDLDWKKNKMTLSSYEEETYTSGDGFGGEVTVFHTYKIVIDLEKK